MKKSNKKIDWNRLLRKAVEDGIKKAIELLILAIVAGAAIKLVIAAVPAVALGAVVAKVIKVKFLDCLYGV